MICKVKQTIDKYGLLDSNVKSVAVGFSGGADSVCLIDILSKLKEEYGIILKAVHVNHNIRGEEAKRDELFVKDFCEERGIELLSFSLDVPSLAKERKISLEECGRQVRYECFAKACCDKVAVAHTLSDSIETMLFNLARGTGTKGLAGISPFREPDVIRPLIACTRKEIEAYCEENSLDFVTDSTNLSDDYTRNHIRHNIVPAFERINPDFEASFCRAMSSLREDDEYLSNEADALFEKSKRSNGYSIAELNLADKAILKRFILRLVKDKMNKPPEAKHIEGCYSLIKNAEGKIELSKDLYICADGDIISFCTKQNETLEWKSFFANGLAEAPDAFYALEEAEEISDCSFDADKVCNELFVSSRLAGDTFTFRSRGVTKSLKKLFNEMKIPAADRNKIAVLHDGKNVVWIENIGVNAMYIPDKNTQKILKIKRTDEND